VTLDRLAPRTVLIAVALFSGGCAGKHPVVSHPPATSPTSPAPAERAGGATSNPAAPPAASAAHPGKHSKTPPAPAPVGYSEEGNASWYGVPFNGRRASNGEIYDMNKLTAAHRTLPFETVVRVTNLNNGKTTTVRITDRGPFVDNRIIDLSQAAAREIESIGPGVVPVRLEVLGNVDVSAGFFTVQVGAFRERANAERLRERLSVSYSPIFIQQYDAGDSSFYRVRVGRISGEEAAQQYADQLRSKEGFTPFVVRLDEAAPSGVK
jgi:peptidoglycan lytic transglycosylase